MRRLRFLILLILIAGPVVHAQAVRITAKPHGLVSGVLAVPMVADAPVEKLALFINGVKFTEGPGRSLTAQVLVGFYIRRLRMRAVGYDAEGNIAGEDEMVINDPRPPFRVRMQAPREWPEAGAVRISANILKPMEIVMQGVDFYVGEEKVATIAAPPYEATIDAARFPGAVYARVVARGGRSEEANDAWFFGDRARESLDVTVQQIPLSVSGGGQVVADDLELLDNGVRRPIEMLVPSSELPLHVVLLIDYSESMLEELPVVKAAAKSFASALLRPQDRLAVVGFNQKTFWLTGYTNDPNAAAQVVDRVQPIGETHLYDSVIEMLYEIQRMPGRHALVVLTDGVDQGSRFKLDHLVHYARYAGVPVYPIVKNKWLSRWMRLGVGQLQARKLRNVAEDTGATYFIIQSERELGAVYSRIAGELRNQMQIVFHSEPEVPDEWRMLRISSRTGKTLRIPKGYFP